MWHGMEGIGWGWLGLGFLHMVLFWGLIILALGALFKWFLRDSLLESNAMDILKARYAKGELTREQFDKLKGEIQ